MKNKHNCKGCESRYVGCHDKCASYIAFTIERNEMLVARHEEIRKQQIVESHREDLKTKTFKRDKTLNSKFRRR